MPKIIVYTGTHGTGKTTAASKRVDALRVEQPDADIVLVEESARLCPYPINLDGTLLSQRWIFARQMERELSALAGSPDFIIMDRCVVDVAAYTSTLDRPGCYAHAEAMLALCGEHVAIYDEVIFLATHNNNHWHPDGVREARNAQWRNQVEWQLLEFYRRLGVANIAGWIIQ